MTFTITPPEELKLPTPGKKDTTVPYYDLSQPLGYRCAWSIVWVVFKDEESTRKIQPREWRFNGDSPDLEKLPNAYLLAELEDIACRGGVPFGTMAANLYFEYGELKDEGQEENWRYRSIDLMQKVHAVPPERVSSYNPPSPKLIKHTTKVR